MEVLILYSEYSKKCKRFMRQLNNDPVIDIKKINKMCIDNPDIRNVIKQHIKKVPTVMVKSNSDIELYEGSEAYEWLTNFSEQIYNQLEMEENMRLEMEEKLRLEKEEAEKLKKKKEEPLYYQHSLQNVKCTPSQIQQERSVDLTFSDEPVQTGSEHVSQTKSISNSIIEKVKNMETERNRDEIQIQKLNPNMPPPIQPKIV